MLYFLQVGYFFSEFSRCASRNPTRSVSELSELSFPVVIVFELRAVGLMNKTQAPLVVQARLILLLYLAWLMQRH
jgi:hypothetical protein